MAVPIACARPWNLPEQSGFELVPVVPGTGADENGDGSVWVKYMNIGGWHHKIEFFIEIDNREPTKPPPEPIP